MMNINLRIRLIILLISVSFFVLMQSSCAIPRTKQFILAEQNQSFNEWGLRISVGANTAPIGASNEESREINDYYISFSRLIKKDFSPKYNQDINSGRTIDSSFYVDSVYVEFPDNHRERVLDKEKDFLVTRIGIDKTGIIKIEYNIKIIYLIFNLSAKNKRTGDYTFHEHYRLKMKRYKPNTLFGFLD